MNHHPASHRGRVASCDRRGFLQVGSLGLLAGGFGLPHLAKLEAAGQAPRSRQHKAVINIFLAGGPSHLDTFDLKPDAPKEIRGDFQSIPTVLPGVRISECFPRLARNLDRCVLVRSVVGAVDDHASYQCMTGWERSSLANLGGRPSIGAAATKLLGAPNVGVPPFIGLTVYTQHTPYSDSGTPGFLGKTFAPFKPDGPGLANMKLQGTTLADLEERRTLLATLSDVTAVSDGNRGSAELTELTNRAFDVLTSSQLLRALDLSNENPRLREQYGDGKPFAYQGDGPPTDNQLFLVARRLVEAGARCVTLAYGFWDSHGDNFNLTRNNSLKLDQALSALLEDLEQRGMLDDVAVVCWGEFGRTPRINAQAGRDHWPAVSSAILFGGGMRGGQVIGSTNRLGEYAKDRPVHLQEIVATLYHCLGIDVATATVTDPTGRPQYLVERNPIQEII